MPNFAAALLQQSLYARQHARHDHVDARRVGMHAVSLVELRLRRDPVEEEGIEQRGMLLRQPRIHAVEGRLVLGPQIGRCAHAGEQHGKLPFRELGQELVQRLFRLRHGQTPQRIIGAEFDDHGVDILRQRPVEPGGAVERGIARDTAIDHFHVMSPGFQGGLQLDRKRVRRLEAVARGEAVAQRQQGDGLGGSGIDHQEHKGQGGGKFQHDWSIKRHGCRVQASGPRQPA